MLALGLSFAVGMCLARLETLSRKGEPQSYLPPAPLPAPAANPPGSMLKGPRVPIPAAPAMPAPAPPPPPPPAPMPTGPILLTQDPIPVYPGRLYRAVIKVGGMLNLMVNESAVRSRAESEGFINVQVSKSRPPGFPGRATGTYYVTANWGRAPSALDRPSAITIVEAWEG